jgi:hypothetical protein
MQGMNVNKATGYEQKWGISQDWHCIKRMPRK